MSTQHYRRLLSNLPSMAAVVNSFESPEVQCAVFEKLIHALEDVTGEEIPRSKSSSGTNLTGNHQAQQERKSDSEALADVIEGDSIHSIADEE